MALEESSVLEAELARQSDPGRPEASGGQRRKQRKAPRDPPSERRLVEEAQEHPLRRQAEIEGLTAAGHQALVRGHKKEALSSFRKAFALSSETPRHGTQRVCAFNLGAAYVEAGRPEKGLALLLKAQPEEEGEAAGECLGDLFFNIGVAHEGLGDFGQALEAFRKAQGHYCAVQTESEAGTRMRMGDCYLGMGDPWRASQCFLEAGRSYAGAGRLELAATALSEATRLMLRSQEHEDGEVVKVLNECRELCEQIPDRALLGKLYNDIGLSFSELKIFSLAAESFAKALSFCKMEDGEEDRPTDEDAAAAAILQNLGAAHNALGSFSTAVGFHQRAASLHSSLGNRRAQGQCFGNLAYALSQMGDHEAAVENYLHALQAFKDSGDLRGQWQSCEGLAGLRFHLGDPEKAVASYKEALMLISKCQDAPETAAQERIVNKLAEALQSKLSVSSRVLQGSGILTSRPARHFPMSQTFAASSLHRKKETFPPAACHASELSARQRCHRMQAMEKETHALATWSHGPLQWGRDVVAQTTGLKPKEGGCGELAYGAPCANATSALGVPNGHAILASDGTEGDTNRATRFPDQIRGDRAALSSVGRFSRRRLDTSQQRWRDRFKSILCSLM